MTVQINIAQLEDRVLSPLNNIMSLSYGSDVYKDGEIDMIFFAHNVANSKD